MSTAPTAPPPPGAGPDPAGAAAEPRLVRRRTAWDVGLGLLLVAMGALILGDVAIASVVSVLFVGWTLLLGGAVAIIVALFRIGRGGFWTGLLDGALSLVIGLVFVRNPQVTLLTLSLVAGALLVANGIVRIGLAFREREQRFVLLASGVLSVALGLMILNRWPESALWLLGTLLGVQVMVDGVLLILLGRLRLTS
ncbi:MAG TPA: DUF308 domain-containing protein [Mycobacteriales bacterium]